jgi:RNA polymerase sigma factor FliA
MDELDAHDDVARLWAAYADSSDRALRDRLVLQYSPLVKFVAGRVRSGLPATVESADLVSEGVIGLMDAIDKFDPSRGLQFQTYAVPRIRGAIVDSLRAADWAPRSVRARAREVERAQQALQARLGRFPEDREVAAELDISQAELREVYAAISRSGVASLDELGAPDDLAEPLGDDLDDEMREALMPAVRALPERDQVIVALYYFEGLTLSEIGQVLGVSESRVSQLNTRATLALRAAMAAGAGRD